MTATGRGQSLMGRVERPQQPDADFHRLPMSQTSLLSWRCGGQASDACLRLSLRNLRPRSL